MNKILACLTLVICSLTVNAQRFSMNSSEGKRDLIFIAIILAMIAAVVILQFIKYRKDKS